MSRALVLTGGGARAAYQVGVLKGIATILPRYVYNPFPIICGTSAGAINALSIAGRAGPFRLRTSKLERIWNELTPSDVYRTDFAGVVKNTFHVLASFCPQRLWYRQADITARQQSFTQNDGKLRQVRLSGNSHKEW